MAYRAKIKTDRGIIVICAQIIGTAAWAQGLTTLNDHLTQLINL
jgi:hypothetical protein